MNGVVEMLIGYTNEMTDHELSELADWADYHAKDVPNPSWKRAYALIREGADLLLRRRAGSKQDPPVEQETPEKEPAKTTGANLTGQVLLTRIMNHRKRSSSYDHV